MSSRLRKKSSKNKTWKRKEQKVSMYYPYEMIGEGAYKQVFNISSVSKPVNIKDDILTQKERESMGVILDERITGNVVLIRPNKELSKKEMGEFLNEMELQQKFSDLGFAPKVLKVNKELRNDDGYTPFAYTYRCDFNMCDYEFNDIKGRVEKTF